MTSCDAAVWADGLAGFVFAGNDGTNGCELYLHRPDQHHGHDRRPSSQRRRSSWSTSVFTPSTVEKGCCSTPRTGRTGASCGSATERPTGRRPWSRRNHDAVAWADGFLVRSTTNELMWTNGSDLRAWTTLPAWTTTQQQAVSANLSGLSDIGQAWLHADQTAVWFSAMDVSGDVEPYRLDTNGALTSWAINAFGSTELTRLVSVEDDVLAAVSRGGVKQVLRLHDNGTHAWLTSIAPASGDTPRRRHGLARHWRQPGLRRRDGRRRAWLWTTNLANGITLQLSSTILAPGAQVGVATTGSRLLFDCLTASTGLETCMTDGTPQGSRVVHDLTPGLMSSDVKAVAAVKDGWLVVSDGTVNGSTRGVSLWVVEGEAMRPVYNPWQGSGNSSQAITYGQLIISPTQAWMIAHDGVHGHEWHRWSHGELSDDWIVIHR